MNNKSTHGGARNGAGRKNVKGETKRIACRLPADMVDFLKSDNDKTLTEMIEEAVKWYYKL